MQLSQDAKRVETIYGSFFSFEGDLITEQLEKYSAHTRNELAMLRKFIREEGDILDIGAHIGTFSIPFSRFNRKKGKIFAFEANLNNYELLIKNIHVNKLDRLIIPIHAVVSEQENIGYFATLPKDGNSGMYYYMPLPEQSDANVISVNIDNWHDQQNRENQIQLIKIDVEGAELNVLNACQKLIQKYKPILYIEINRVALTRFNNTYMDMENILTRFGYHYFRNIGERNSNNDMFEISFLNTIEQGGDFFDLLAVHPTDVRYPRHCYS